MCSVQSIVQMTAAFQTCFLALENSLLNISGTLLVESSLNLNAQWKENKSVICSFFLFSTKACIQAWSLTLFTRLRLCQKLKAFSWGQVMISKDTQSSCQSYPYTGCFRVSIHISKLYCLLSFQSQGREESTPQMLNWSRLVFDWSWVHKDQGSEGHFYTSHMQALLHLYDSPDSVGFIHKYHSENEDHGIWSHQFMGNTWGNSGNSVRLYFGGLQSHCRWWLHPWN